MARKAAKNSRQTNTNTENPDNTNTENPEENKLPIAMEPAKTIKESVARTDVNPEDVAKNVPYDDEGYSEAGLLDDNV